MGPSHPYTIGLLRSLPRLDRPRQARTDAHRGLAARPGRGARRLSVRATLRLAARGQLAHQPTAPARAQQPRDPGPLGGHYVACHNQPTPRRPSPGIRSAMASSRRRRRVRSARPSSRSRSRRSARSWWCSVRTACRPRPSRPPAPSTLPRRRPPRNSPMTDGSTTPVAPDAGTTAVASAAADATNGASGDVLLEVQDLRVWFPITGGVLRRRTGWVQAVDGVCFTIRARRDPGPRGRVRLGQDDHRAHHRAHHVHRWRAPSAWTARTSCRSTGRRCASGAGSSRWSSRTRIPASTRGRPSATSWPSRCGSTASRAAPAGAKRVARAAGAGRPRPRVRGALSARVQRRPAAAHRHRPGARRGAGADRLRRADLAPSTCRSRRRSSTSWSSSRASSG